MMVSALGGLASNHGTREKWGLRRMKALGAGVHEDAYVRLPLHRPDMSVSRRDTLVAGVGNVIEGDMLDNARNVAGRLVGGGVLQGSWR